jgi:hypothetical protein
MKALPSSAPTASDDTGGSSKDPFSLKESVSLVLKMPHLRTLALIVVLASTASTLVDYQFKEYARTSMATKTELTRFLGTFYSWTSALSLVIQLAIGTFLGKLGIVVTLAALPVFLFTGSMWVLFFPSLRGATALRGGDYSLRKSLHRSAIEVAYVPIPDEKRRKAKTLIDSVLDAGAEGLGSLIIFLWITLGGFPSRQLSIFVLILSAILLGASWLMGREYFKTLRARLTQESGKPAAPPTAEPPSSETEEDVPALMRLLAQSSTYEKARAALLAREDIALPVLLKSLTDEKMDLSISRRIPRLLAQSKNALVDQTLLVALEKQKFEIRYHIGVALMRRKGQRLITLTKEQKETIWSAIRAEVHLDRPIWEMQELLEDADSAADPDGFVTRKVEMRGALSLEHTFRLLALVLDSEVIEACYRGITGDSEEHRGFALEYLENVLPDEVRTRIWPFIGDLSGRKREKSVRSAEDVVSDLLKPYRTLIAGDEKSKEALEQLVDEAVKK